MLWGSLQAHALWHVLVDDPLVREDVLRDASRRLNRRRQRVGPIAPDEPGGCGLDAVVLAQVAGAGLPALQQGVLLPGHPQYPLQAEVVGVEGAIADHRRHRHLLALAVERLGLQVCRHADVQLPQQRQAHAEDVHELGVVLA